MLADYSTGLITTLVRHRHLRPFVQTIEAGYPYRMHDTIDPIRVMSHAISHLLALCPRVRDPNIRNFLSGESLDVLLDILGSLDHGIVTSLKLDGVQHIEPADCEISSDLGTILKTQTTIKHLSLRQVVPQDLWGQDFFPLHLRSLEVDLSSHGTTLFRQITSTSHLSLRCLDITTGIHFSLVPNPAIFPHLSNLTWRLSPLTAVPGQRQTIENLFFLDFSRLTSLRLLDVRWSTRALPGARADRAKIDAFVEALFHKLPPSLERFTMTVPPINSFITFLKSERYSPVVEFLFLQSDGDWSGRSEWTTWTPWSRARLFNVEKRLWSGKLKIIDDDQYYILYNVCNIIAFWSEC